MSLSPTKMKRKLICSEHFKQNDFASARKCKLKRFAVPKLYTEEQCLKVLTPEKTYSTKLTTQVSSVKRKIDFTVTEDLSSGQTLSPKS